MSTTAEIQEKIIQIVSEQMSADKGEISRNTSFVNDLNADSLDTVELVMELEDEFDAAARDEEEPDPKDDAMLVEAGYILRDYIGLVRQVAMVENFDQAVQ